METIEDRLERLEFYNRLTVKSMDFNLYPFYRLIMDRMVTEEEMKETLLLCDELEQRYAVQKEEGFVNCLELLIHFAGMLNPKLKPRETIQALMDQKLYLELTEKLLELSMHYE